MSPSDGVVDLGFPGLRDVVAAIGGVNVTKEGGLGILGGSGSEVLFFFATRRERASMSESERSSSCVSTWKGLG
jgi:hypothetical protein